MCEVVSIKDIAAECGVSAATVSKALNDHADVGSATKQKVRETAKRMGYMPNSMARALKTNKTYNIGVLMVDKANNGLKHRYFSAILDSFKVTMEKNGYDLTFISSQVGTDSCSYLEHCRYRNVDGVLAACVDFTAPEVQELITSDLPMVSIDYLAENAYSVISDNRKGIRDALECALECGHRKIAYIYGEASQVTDVRLQTFREVLAEHGCEVQDRFLKQSQYLNAELAYRLTMELLKEDHPTCILYPDDISAVAGASAVRESGYTIGNGGISLIGYDGTPLLQLFRPKLTTIQQDTEMMGRKAAELLLRLLRKEEIPEGQRVQYCSGRLLKGETVGTPDD